MVAVQMYCPLSDTAREEKVCSTEVEAVASITVESGSVIFMSGSATKPGTTLHMQCME